jgi:hypothetical protein
MAAPLMTLQFTAPAAPVSAPSAPDEDAEVVAFDLRVPPPEPSAPPKPTQDTSDRLTAGGKSSVNAAPASIETGL